MEGTYSSASPLQRHGMLSLLIEVHCNAERGTHDSASRTQQSCNFREYKEECAAKQTNSKCENTASNTPGYDGQQLIKTTEQKHTDGRRHKQTCQN